MDKPELCGRLALVSYGRLVAVGKPTELKRKAIDDERVVLVKAESSRIRVVLKRYKSSP